MSAESTRPATPREEIHRFQDEGDASIHRAQTLCRLTYEMMCDLSVGEPFTRGRMDRFFVLLESLEREVNAFGEIFESLNAATRKLDPVGPHDRADRPLEAQP